MKSLDPHVEGVLDTDDPYRAKRPVEGRLVCVLDARSERRGMQLTAHPSRAVPAGEIHEVALTDEASAAPGARVDRVAYLGFAEIVRGGVILVGDRVTVGEQEVGRVVGFDETHFPNHLNILLYAPRRDTGGGLGLQLEAPVVFARQAH
jgi:hypothetical protein